MNIIAETVTSEFARPKPGPGHAVEDIRPVFLSGGAGTRLWPLSRMKYPKQLLPLLSEKSLLQETAGRIAGLSGIGDPLVVCHQEHRFLVAEQLKQVSVEPHRIVLEPEGRNTAPALVVAALLAARDNPDAVLLALPTDHHVSELAAFHDSVTRALEAAKKGWLVTFGCWPERAETGYGYIEGAAAIPDVSNTLAVREFIEKPDAETAARLVASGRHFWNSGMFLLPVGPFLEEVERWQPGLVGQCRDALDKGSRDLDFLRLDAEAFAEVPSVSIDNAVMERSDRVAVMPVEFGWRDVGSWNALHEAKQVLNNADADGNVVEGDVELDGAANCLIHASDRMVAAVDVHDLTIVATRDAVLVANNASAQRVGALVKRLSEKGRQEVEEHPRVYRPWGSYQQVDVGERFQVKRIIVNPGATLSLQMHHHRAEHWVVVRGTAHVHCDGEEKLLRENESTYVPQGTTHRLANPGLMPLHLIEVQSGSYLGEDDIVRFEDSYGRA